MAAVGIREYARHRKCSPAAVRKAIASGRIAAAVTADKQIDVERADKLWGSNTDPGRQLTSATVDPKQQARIVPQAAPDTEKTAAKDDEKGANYLVARGVRETYQARLTKLEFEEKTGKLIPADQVRVAAFNAAREARDKLLTIPDRIAPQFPEIQHRLYTLLQEEIDSVCREIASSVGV